MGKPGHNLIQVMGNLGRDPEMRFTANGKEVCNFSVAVSESWKDKGGEYQERTEWFNVVTWGVLARVCAENLSKGRVVFVQGKMQSREYEDKQGVNRRVWEIQAHSVQFMDAPKKQERRDEDDYNEPFETSKRDDDDGDVPF